MTAQPQLRAPPKASELAAPSPTCASQDRRGGSIRRLGLSHFAQREAAAVRSALAVPPHQPSKGGRLIQAARPGLYCAHTMKVAEGEVIKK